MQEKPTKDPAPCSWRRVTGRETRAAGRSIYVVCQGTTAGASFYDPGRRAGKAVVDTYLLRMASRSRSPNMFFMRSWGRDLLSLTARGQVQNHADDEVDQEHDQSLAAHIEGSHRQQHANEEDDAHDAGPPSNGGSQLVRTLHVGHILTQLEQGQRGDHPGQNEGCGGEAGHGVDHVGAQEGTDEGEDGDQNQAVDSNAVLILLGKPSGDHAGAAHSHEQVCRGGEEAVPGGEQTGDGADGDQPVEGNTCTAGEYGLEHGSSSGRSMS